MLFNSIHFAIFFPIVFLIYWFVLKNSIKKQNVFLLLASYFFYACWDWRFLFLLMFSIFLDYICGIKIHEASSKQAKKKWLLICTLTNIGFLGFFKYCNFFIESFQDFIQLFGLQANIHTLKIILPVGISFYTFHGLSYVLDIYNNRIEPKRNWVNYSLFVSFFPLLVAGPIERATHLLPQVEGGRRFIYSKSIDGLRQVLWGLFKKIVVADGCATYVNQIFENSETQTGGTLVLAAILFTFQIYGDFSGYTDIALGTARMLGFELLQNFNFPYFSRNIAEFWRRWHISLTSWFRDYLYIPLGGSRGGMLKTICNTFIIFLVSGFWHGSNWTFLAWGALHALYMMPSILLKSNRKNIEIVAKGKHLPSVSESFHMFITFVLVVLAWIFFRADNMSHAFSYISAIPKDLFILHLPTEAKIALCMALFMLFIEWLGREGKHALEHIGKVKSAPLRWCFYYILIIFLIAFAGGEQIFIYFQF